MLNFGGVFDYIWILGGGFKYLLCSSLPGEMIQFDEYFFRWVETTHYRIFLIFIACGLKSIRTLAQNFRRKGPELSPLGSFGRWLKLLMFSWLDQLRLASIFRTIYDLLWYIQRLVMIEIGLPSTIFYTSVFGYEVMNFPILRLRLATPEQIHDHWQDIVDAFVEVHPSEGHVFGSWYLSPCFDTFLLQLKQNSFETCRQLRRWTSCI